MWPNLELMGAARSAYMFGVRIGPPVVEAASSAGIWVGAQPAVAMCHLSVVAVEAVILPFGVALTISGPSRGHLPPAEYNFAIV